MIIEPTHEGEPLPPDPIASGEYAAVVESLEADSGRFGDSVRWTFTLAGGDHDGRAMVVITTRTLSPASKLGKWAAAILPDYTPGDRLDATRLHGRLCRLVVEETTTREGVPFGRIVNVLPPDLFTAAARGEEPRP